MKPFKAIILFIIVLTLLLLLAESNHMYSILGIKNKKVPIHDLDGYFYNDMVDLKRLTKPKIFVHLPLERNERNWESFGSRTSTSMNMSIVYLNIKSIIRHCGHYYDVVIMDNQNMHDILEMYNLHDDFSDSNIESLDNYQRKKWENYCKSKILYEFGGAMFEPYFYFVKCPDKSVLQPNKMTITKYTNEGLLNTNIDSIALPYNYMASPRKSKDLDIHLDYLYHSHKNMHRFQTEKYEKSMLNYEKLNIVDPKVFGIQNKQSNPIYYTDLLSSQTNIKFSPNMVAIYVNIEMLNHETKNAWFLRLSPEQLLASNTLIGKHIKYYEEN